MNRAAITALPAVAVLVLAGCAEPTAPDDGITSDILASMHQPPGPHVRPLRGDFTWVFDGWSLPAPGRCPGGGLWFLSTIHGTGMVSHMGRVAADGGHCIDPFTFAFVNGEITLQAANGDQLFGTYEGVAFPGAAPNEVGWIDVLTVTGGTGRFDGAEGSAEETGVAIIAFDPATGLVTGGTGWSRIEGTIRYDASSRQH